LAEKLSRDAVRKPLGMSRAWDEKELKLYFDLQLESRFAASKHKGWTTEWDAQDEVVAVSHPDIPAVHLYSWIQDGGRLNILGLSVFKSGTYDVNAIIPTQKLLLGGPLWAWSGVLGRDVKTWWAILDPVLLAFERREVVDRDRLRALLHFP
jgi:hypothetical protein